MSSIDGLPTTEPGAVGFDADRLSRITATMDAAVAAGELPGAVTVVLRHGQVVHAHATGTLDMERETPLGMDSLFRMYSQTKPVMAVVLMSLFEEHAFELNDPISRWIPELANRLVVTETPPHDRVRGAFPPQNVEPARREIMIMDLMTMTSGLPAIGKLPAAYWPLLERTFAGSGFMPGDARVNDPPRSYEEMVLANADLPLYAHPGDRWNYGSDFDVLSLFLTRLTGKDLDELFRERVFDPLGMDDSGFYCDDADQGRLVTDHTWDAEGNLAIRDRPETAEKVRSRSRDLRSGNGLFGGMLCSAPDYTRFAQMLLNGGELDGVRILGRKTVELMTANHLGDREIDLLPIPNYGFGLGYAVRKSVERSFYPGSAGTYGWGGAAGTWFFVDPLEDLVGLFFSHVFLYGNRPGGMADLTRRFMKMTYQALV